jgi:hypothetical protein
MIMKNQLVALALFASISACSSDKKSGDKTPENPPVVTETVTEATADTSKSDQAGQTEETAKPVEPKPAEPVDPKPAEPVEPKPAEPVTPTPVVKLDIEGSWTSCSVEGQGSVSFKLVFGSEGALDISLTPFKDTECKDPLTEGDIEARTKTKGKAATQDADNLRPIISKGTYKVGEILPSMARTLDMTYESGNAVFLAYKIEKDQLSITGACDEASKATGCQTISGDSADTRSVDFDNQQVTILTRQ